MSELLVFACDLSTRRLQLGQVRGETGEEDSQGEDKQGDPESSSKQNPTFPASVQSFAVHGSQL